MFGYGWIMNGKFQQFTVDLELMVFRQHLVAQKWCCRVNVLFCGGNLNSDKIEHLILYLDIASYDAKLETEPI